MSDSSQFQPRAILIIDLISRATISGILYGIALALYWFSAQAIYPRLRDASQRKGSIVSFISASIVILIGLTLMALNSRLVQVAYIDNDKVYEGPMPHRIETWINWLGIVLDALTMGIQLWRVWVVWGATRYRVLITTLPTLLLLSYLGMEITITLLVQLEIPVPGRTVTIYFYVLYALATATTVLATLLVILRLLSVRRRHIKLMAGGSDFGHQYAGISAMLAESCVLESTWTLASLVSFIVESPVNEIFSITENNIAIIAFLLVIYRVSAGRAWNSDTDRQLSTMRWNHDEQSTTRETTTGISNYNLPSHGPDLVVESNLPVTHVVV
ncbi:hypothetical protein P691DRAFT_680740 [Macrolepiota fuliginosa MF-IS2]|uniref:Uncharacterized protein n=1 Tax=Macrolepiota fuliginosa MF-IS2 TaxID=1400762 RepID=A0A9P5X119_9AGAR|nr:hypothetical protein P691DRAFT_680740 [Macrolepiota fuliginosa MF-IS2]